jgi:hypothetical protein
MLIFDILHDPFWSLSQKVGLSYLEVFGCDKTMCSVGGFCHGYRDTTQFRGNL